MISVDLQCGWTALMLAARNNDIDTVKVLLDAGAKKNLRNIVSMCLFCPSDSAVSTNLVFLKLRKAMHARMIF